MLKATSTIEGAIIRHDQSSNVTRSASLQGSRKSPMISIASVWEEEKSRKIPFGHGFVHDEPGVDLAVGQKLAIEAESIRRLMRHFLWLVG